MVQIGVKLCLYVRAVDTNIEGCCGDSLNKH